MMRRNWWLVGSLAVTVAVAVPLGCGAGSDGSDFGDGTGAAAASTGTAASSAHTGTGGEDFFDAGDNDGSLQDGDVCEGVTETASLLPLHMIIAVDRSGSMDYYGYWHPTVQALTAFVEDPLSDGLYVGLNYFPAPSGGDNCTVSLWNPIQVPGGAPPLALLPDDAAVLVNSLSGVGTGNMTPMWGALQGSYQFAQTLLQTYPNDKVVVVLASDGYPTECGTYEEIILNICNDLVTPALNAGVETYTVAIDQAVVAPMNAISAAGGTQQTYDVSQNINLFAEKMAEIRGSALGCEYLIPEQDGEEFDPLKVNLIFTPTGGTPETIPQVANEGACGGGDGWYFDDPVTPTRIILCPNTCTRVEADQEATMEVKFGCPSETR